MQHIIPNLDKLIKNLQLFLYSDNEVKRVFSPAPIVSYRSARKIKAYIVRSKLYSIEKKVESGNSRCQVLTNIQVTETFSSFVTKSPYKINHNFNCNSKYLIYLLSCKTCGKQYSGKTVDNVRVDGIITKQMLEKQLVVTEKAVNNNFFKIIFCRITIMDF